jgi:50S ribosomal subunit-associated GTPase HflX
VNLPRIFVSARTGEGLPALRQQLSLMAAAKSRQSPEANEDPAEGEVIV